MCKVYEINLEGVNLGWINKEMICAMIGCGYLLVLSVQDFRERMISGTFLVFGAVAAVGSQIIWNRCSIWECIGGLLIGLLFIGISRITREGFGYGDSILITILGIYVGIWNLMYVLVIAFLLTAIWSIFILIRFRFHREKALPFIPFLTAGYMGFVLLEVL